MNRKQSELDLGAFFSRIASNQAIKSVLLGVFSLRLAFLVLSVGFPTTAHAGVFSFVSNLFTSAEAVSESSPTSQNMALLQSSLSPNLNSERGDDVIIVDDSSLVGETGPVGTLANVDDHSNSNQISIYVVHEGDTLSEIAEIFDVSVNTIIWANDLQGKKIKKDQILIILPVSGIQYTVKSGDTVQGVAKKYKADLQEILNYNNLTQNSKLKVGEVVLVPDAEPVVVALPKGASKVKSAGTVRLPGFFGSPAVGARRSQGLHGTNGVDLAAPHGSAILAAAEGDVIAARIGGWNAGYGNYIVIKRSNGTQTLYGHLSGVLVYQGQHVLKGQKIGEMGSTGNSTGTHLHFEVRGRGVVNPCAEANNPRAAK